MPQVAALLREDVVVARGALLIRHPRQHARVDKTLETLGEHVSRDSESRLELVEAGVAEEHIAEDEERPPLADDLEALSD